MNMAFAEKLKKIRGPASKIHCCPFETIENQLQPIRYLAEKHECFRFIKQTSAALLVSRTFLFYRAIPKVFQTES